MRKALNALRPWVSIVLAWGAVAFAVAFVLIGLVALVMWVTEKP